MRARRQAARVELLILTQYYPLERFPAKSLYALEELLTKAG